MGFIEYPIISNKSCHEPKRFWSGLYLRHAYVYFSLNWLQSPENLLEKNPLEQSANYILRLYCHHLSHYVPDQHGRNPDRFWVKKHLRIVRIHGRKYFIPLHLPHYGTKVSSKYKRNTLRITDYASSFKSWTQKRSQITHSKLWSQTKWIIITTYTSRTKTSTC